MCKKPSSIAFLFLISYFGHTYIWSYLYINLRIFSSGEQILSLSKALDLVCRVQLLSHLIIK